MDSKELKPSDFDLTGDFMGSKFRNRETEIIARNIVVISLMMSPHAWTPFTWEKYCELCNRECSPVERGILEALVHGGKPALYATKILEPGYLEKNDADEYFVTEKFLSAISQFTK